MFHPGRGRRGSLDFCALLCFKSQWCLFALKCPLLPGLQAGGIIYRGFLHRAWLYIGRDLEGWEKEKEHTCVHMLVRVRATWGPSLAAEVAVVGW